ncbi:MAG: hypothetical protein E6Q38_04370 [Crocinitomicaceae bacterium]|nr:MAG: hypothetical protein E6Q38_04370 [Crocinitomicaceae bacterium]
MRNIINKVLLTVLLSLPTISIAQTTYYPGQIRIIVHDSTIIPQPGGISKNVAFQSILDSFNITNITQPMSFAKTPELRRLFELNTTQSEDSLFNALAAIDELFLSIEKCPIPQNLYDPADYMWWLTINNQPGDWLWYLKRIQANLAWDITKGSTNVKVAVIDSGVDKDHPDLIGKISPPYDFYTGGPFTTNVFTQTHGTTVATLLAAETLDQGQTSNGQMASIGYNTQIMFSAYQSIDACVFASTVLGANIISISWLAGCAPSTVTLLAEQEILNNGTCIIRAAGNGTQHCNGDKVYPFSGYEDDRTLVISSTGKDDKHFATDLPSTYQSNSHYPEVDLCARGYTVLCGIPYQGGGGHMAIFNIWGYFSKHPVSFWDSCINVFCEPLFSV